MALTKPLLVSLAWPAPFSCSLHFRLREKRKCREQEKGAGHARLTPSCVFAVFFVELSHEFAQYIHFREVCGLPVNNCLFRLGKQLTDDQTGQRWTQDENKNFTSLCQVCVCVCVCVCACVCACVCCVLVYMCTCVCEGFVQYQYQSVLCVYMCCVYMCCVYMYCVYMYCVCMYCVYMYCVYMNCVCTCIVCTCIVCTCIVCTWIVCMYMYCVYMDFVL